MLKTYDGHFNLTTKKSLHIIFKRMYIEKGSEALGSNLKMGEQKGWIGMWRGYPLSTEAGSREGACSLPRKIMDF